MFPRVLWAVSPAAGGDIWGDSMAVLSPCRDVINLLINLKQSSREYFVCLFSLKSKLLIIPTLRWDHPPAPVGFEGGIPPAMPNSRCADPQLDSPWPYPGWMLGM